MKEYIKKYQDFIFERKTFIEHNVKLFLQVISKIPKNKAHLYFISLRSSTNVTLINPNNDFATPTGTYTYPLFSYYDALQESAKQYDSHNVDGAITKIFPFKGNNPAAFIYLYKLKPNVYKNNILTSASSVSDVVKMWETKLKGKLKPSTDVPSMTLDAMMEDIVEWEKNNNGNVTDLISHFDMDLQSYGDVHGTNAHGFIGDTPVSILWYLLLFGYGKDEMRRICQKNGLLGFVDYQTMGGVESVFVLTDFGGGGSDNHSTVRVYLNDHKDNKGRIAYIHKAEPAQAVFFGSRSLYSKVEHYDIEHQNNTPISTDDLLKKRESREDMYGKNAGTIRDIIKSGEWDKLNKYPMQDVDDIANRMLDLPTGSWGRLSIFDSYLKIAEDWNNFPEWLKNSTQLAKIEIKSSEFTEIPSWIKNNKGLKDLSYLPHKTKNALRKLPNWIGEMSELTHLNLNDNLLTTLPLSMKNLKKLEYLSLKLNLFTELPPVLRVINSLEELRVTGNRITVISNLPKNLNSLFMYGNPIKGIPDDFNQKNYPKLKAIHISYSKDYDSEKYGWLEDILPSKFHETTYIDIQQF